MHLYLFVVRLICVDHLRVRLDNPTNPGLDIQPCCGLSLSSITDYFPTEEPCMKHCRTCLLGRYVYLSWQLGLEGITV